jgi:hypothetical protein
MRFAIGEIVVDVVIDDDDFELPLVEFLPGLDLAALGQDRNVFEPEFIDVGRNVLRCAIQTFVLRLAGRIFLVDTCIGEHKDRTEISAWNQRSGYGLPRSAAPGRRRPGFGRGRVLHSPSHRPCRLEHRARRWLLGADFPPCALLGRPDGTSRLDGSHGGGHRTRHA